MIASFTLFSRCRFFVGLILGIGLLQGCSSSQLSLDGLGVTGKAKAGVDVVTPASPRSSEKLSRNAEMPILLTVPPAKVLRIAPLESVALAQSERDDISKVPVRVVASKSLFDGAVLPQGIFSGVSSIIDRQARDQSESLIESSTRRVGTTVESSVGSTFSRDIAMSVLPAKPVRVTLYVSQTTVNYFAAMGVDYQNNIDIWEDFLRRHEIPFEVERSLDALSHPSIGVLLLPSAVALNNLERQAIADFRKRGGSLLTTWLTGVRGEVGEWRGFDFMESTLSTKVMGNTQLDTDDVYIMPHGDNPVTHSLPAGLRIWTERVPGWFPLRLSGVHSAAEIMDWSRTVRAGKATSVVSFNERIASAEKSSRALVLGYPEQLWVAAERNAMDAIAQDALLWLARKPDASLVAWPWPYRCALVLAIDASDTLSEKELRYADLAESLGGRATYFVLTDTAQGSSVNLKKLQSRGHEIAYMGDRFDSFADQSVNVQIKRFDTMSAEMQAAEVDSGLHLGFHAPMEGYDKTTEKLLIEKGFSYYVGGAGVSEARLPFLSSSLTPLKDTFVTLPRTQNGPDDALAEGDSTANFENFLSEFDSAAEMAGLNVIRIPSHSLMNEQQWAAFSHRAKRKHQHTWSASAAQVADWWRERERIEVSLDDAVSPPLLTVSVSGEGNVGAAATILVNLPSLGAKLRLAPDTAEFGRPSVIKYDTWRDAVVLDGLASGTHRWFLMFDDASSMPIEKTFSE